MMERKAIEGMLVSLDTEFKEWNLSRQKKQKPVYDFNGQFDKHPPLSSSPQ